MGMPLPASALYPRIATGVDWSASLAHGLVGCWIAEPLGGSTGLYRDVSGISADAVIGNASGTTLLTGQHALTTTDNISNTLSASGAAWDSPSLTIAAWGRTTSTGSAQICAREAGGGTRIFQFRINANKLDWISNITGTIDTRTSTTTVNDGNLHLFVATYEDSVRTAVAVDGVVESETTRSGALLTGSTPSMCFLDDNRAGTSPWNNGGTGGIGSIMMWDRGFSDAEIAALYAPASRWSMLERPRVRTYFIPATAGGGATAFKPPSGLSLLGVGV